MIDVQQSNLILRINDEHVTFNVFKSMKYSFSADTCFKIDVIDQFIDEKFQECRLEDSLEVCITQSKHITVENNGFKEQVMYLEANLPYLYSKKIMVKTLDGPHAPKLKPSIEEPPTLELKTLPSYLKYVFLKKDSKLPVVISSSLSNV